VTRLLSGAASPAPDPPRELPLDDADRLYGRLAQLFGRNGPVLDVGTGSGVAAAELIRRGVVVLAIDVVDWRPTASSPLLLGDACRLPVRSGTCGGVHLARVLYHVPDWRATLAEAVRVLAPGGVVCVWLGGSLFSGVLWTLVDALHAEARHRGLRPADLGADPPRPEAVDAELGRFGACGPDLLEVSGVLPVTPRQAVNYVVDNPQRWAPGQDLSGLADIGAKVLAGCPVDVDIAVPQERNVQYRVYRTGDQP
jgi:SAM-dependent methyltransferase